MATPTQVNDAIKLKITFGIGVTVPPNTYTNYITVDDISDYASILGSGETIKTLYHIKTSVGTTVYKSVGYDTDDFATNEYPDNDPLAQKQLPLAADGVSPVEGAYTILVKAKFDDGAGGDFIVTKTILSQPLCLDDKPTVSLSSSYSCSGATFTSTDGTSYGNSKYTLQSVVRSHTVYPPDISGQSAVTVDSSTNSVGSLWSGVTYEVKLTATVTYSKTDTDGIQTFFIFYVSGTHEKKVNCDDALCKIYCLLNKIRNEYYTVLGKNPTREKEIYSQFILGWHEYFMAIQARICTPANEEVHIAKFYEVTKIDPGCDCGCEDGSTSGSGAPVVPTTPGAGNDGADGTDGQTPEIRLNGTTLQWKYSDEDASAWVDLINLTTLSGFADFSGYNYELYISYPGEQKSSSASKSALETLYTTSLDLQAGSVALNTDGSYFKVRVAFTFKADVPTTDKICVLDIGGYQMAVAVQSTVGNLAPCAFIEAEVHRKTSAVTNFLKGRTSTDNSFENEGIIKATTLNFGAAFTLAVKAFIGDSTADDDEIRLNMVVVEKYKKLG